MILDYNRPDLTNRAVRSIRETGDAEIYVVENGTTESGRAVTGADIVIQSSSNKGFSGGMNQGITHALSKGKEIIVLMNNDAIATPGAINILCQSLGRDNRVGIAVPSRSHSRGLLRRIVYARNAAWTGSSFVRGQSQTYPPRKVRRVTGFCMALRGSALDHTGMLDEDFFFGKEDDEISFRMRMNGFDLVECPDSVVVHAIGSSTSFRSEEQVEFLSYHAGRGNGLLVWKTGGSTLGGLLRTCIETVRVAIKFGVIAGRLPGRVLVAGVLGFRDGLARRLGSRVR